MALLDFLTSGAPLPAGTAPISKTTSTATPDWYTNYAKDLLSGQQNIATTPYQTYQGPRIADFTDTQRQGMDQTVAAAGLGAAPIQQGITQATNASALSGAPLLAGVNLASSLAANNPANAAIRQGIDLSQAQIGQSGLSAAQPYLQQAGQNAYGNVASYMNPYNDAVTNRIAELGVRNLNEKILPGINDQFISSGQPGSSRNAMMFNRAARDTGESILAQQNAALQSGYGGALTASQADLQRQSNLAQTAGNLGTAGVTSGLDVAKTIADLGTAGTTSNLNVAKTLGDLGQTVSSTGLNTATTLGTLGTQAQTAGLAGANAVTGVGAAQQGLNQQNLTLAYQDYLKQKGYPQEQIDAALKTFTGIGGVAGAVPQAKTEVGIEPTSYAQQYQPSALATGLGTLATGAGIAKDLAAVDWSKLGL